jgi:hypothetical protein
VNVVRNVPGTSVSGWVNAMLLALEHPLCRRAKAMPADSQDAINLYNFKHGLPGELFPEAEESQRQNSADSAG